MGEERTKMNIEQQILYFNLQLKLFHVGKIKITDVNSFVIIENPFVFSFMALPSFK